MTPAPRAVEGPALWRGADVTSDAWLVRLPKACLDELGRALSRWDGRGRPEDADADAFELPVCRALMRGVRERIEHGLGFVVLDRLPAEDWSEAQLARAFWLLSSLCGRPVEQSRDGRRLYRVEDTGRPVGNGVRPDSTALEITFHTDNSYNTAPPEVFALVCCRRARSGGSSAVVSFATAHNLLLDRDEAAVARLYAPFVFDRQREIAPGEPEVFQAPVFSRLPALRVRYSDGLIKRGYQMARQDIDPAGADALARLHEVLSEPALRIGFDLEPGQVQFTNNRYVGHARSAFVDQDEPRGRRLMLRIWIRDQGAGTYSGEHA